MRGRGGRGGGGGGGGGGGAPEEEVVLQPHLQGTALEEVEMEVEEEDVPVNSGKKLSKVNHL